jgi:hypothetical protein
MFLGVIRAALASEEAARLLRQCLAEQIRGEIAATLRAQPELRIALAASQLAGIAIARDAIGLAPLAAADHRYPGTGPSHLTDSRPGRRSLASAACEIER